MEEASMDFRCPISMEIIQDPVTISTGVTYERKNIERWFFVYKRRTCPATMQRLENFDLTPNHTLKRLIDAWKDRQVLVSSISSESSMEEQEQLISLLNTIRSSPFKVSLLRKLRSLIDLDDYIKEDLVKSGGVELLSGIVVQILVENMDSIVFKACEEALNILEQLLPLSNGFLLSKPEFMKSLLMVLQHGSPEGRLCAITLLRETSKFESDLNWEASHLEIDMLASLLQLLSDEISTTASSRSLDVLIDILITSKRRRLKAIEAGAVCIMVELLPDSNRVKCEKLLLVLKLLCESAEGRSTFTDHGLAIAAVSNKILRVSELATKIAVKILWLVCNFYPREKSLEDMLLFGSVAKLVDVLNLDRRNTVKNKAMKILKLHGNYWMKLPCFPPQLLDYLKLTGDYRY